MVCYPLEETNCATYANSTGKQYEENFDHLLFHCAFLTQSRELVKEWLRLMGGQAFNRQTIIEMTGINSGIENFA